jgi:DNA-binding beta-propeller fold protein YncE
MPEHVPNLRWPLLLVVGGLWLTGCTTPGPQAAAGPSPAASLVWPAPPDPPRIAWVQNFTRPSDLGIRRSAFGRMANWVTGSQKGDEQLLRPFGVSVDEKDELCVTDTAANAVWLFDVKSKKCSRWQKVGSVRFESPVAMVAHNGTCYVADSALGIIAFSVAGKLLFTITNHLGRPSGLAVDDKTLWVADAQRHCILKFDLAGQFVSEFGHRGTGQGEFNFPTHLARDAEGRIYVTDSLNGRVQLFDPDGRFLGQIGQFGDSPGCFSRPKGVTVDSLGHVYVADANFDNVQIFDRQGQVLLSLGEAGKDSGQFWLPAGVAANRQNEIFVADSYNRRVQIFRYIGPQ